MSDEIKKQSDKNHEYTLYLDMDGVLVDFNGGFKQISNGADIKKYAQANGEEAARKQYLEAGIKFWSELAWQEGGKEVWATASRLFERVCILSSAGTTDPVKAQVVEAGKLQWLAKNMPSMPKNNIFIVRGKHLKQQYASRGSVLVDDVSKTIKEWNAAGGYGVLHNYQHYKKTIETLEDIARPIKLSEIVKRFKR